MKTTRDSDETALVAAARTGSHEAFEALVERHQDRLFGTLHRLVGDADRALDLTQETFLKAWRGLDRFAGDAAFGTWLHRIARNAVISAHRFDAARPRLELSRMGPTDDDESRFDAPGGAPGPVAEAERSEARDLVLRALDELPFEQREILVLRDFEDHPYEVIGELLEVPVGTVRSRLHRARTALRKRLESWEGWEGWLGESRVAGGTA